MRSRAELLAASGYVDQAKNFDALLAILDGELRLITPSDPEGKDDADSLSVHADEKYYQLTHDYLVHSLRDWLARKQKETWRGRAALILADFAAQWAPRRKRRYLPSLPVFLYLCLGVPWWKWQPLERSLMRAAGRYHALVWGSVLAVLLAVGYGVSRYTSTVRAESAVESSLFASPAEVPHALEKLAPLRRFAIPLLWDRYRATGEHQQKLHAALALAACGESEQIQGFLLDSVATAPNSEAKNLIEALALTPRESVRGKLLERIQGTNNSDAKARYAIALLYLGDERGVQQVLALTADQVYRTTLILGFKDWHGDLRPIAQRLEKTQLGSVQSGLCAALGLTDPTTLAVEERESVVKTLGMLYRTATDGGVHSAAEWALRNWKAELPALKSKAAPNGWFVNSAGMTLIEVRPAKFIMGHPQVADAVPHEATLTHAFYLADREVTVGQFQEFMNDRQCPVEEKPIAWGGPSKAVGPSPDCPVQQVNSVDALLYCNWLSRREGRQSCYRKAGDSWEIDPIADGYRLPTQAEWEFACRAGSSTLFSFGDNPEHLRAFGFWRGNSGARTWTGGTLLPNGWGFFDMHGNVNEWCWDSGKAPVYKGGSWSSLEAINCSSYGQFERNLEQRHSAVGFRICRIDPANQLKSASE
jgi:formylglycine-generating enzyme required for sulfatase activity